MFTISEVFVPPTHPPKKKGGHSQFVGDLAFFFSMLLWQAAKL